ncbi:hypothetical protein [Hymenobacter sp. BT491]|uniref:hypothetical protein n=1 Tax=Hymenobacter sp. BT491 TaxID=2766779 RepID=UPI00165349BD|nr:hypothetical protein [Hymenobacter sp. BT491]MBC6992341.1 hypothetical protein [Hymenobacter sp. BT491]
MRLENNAAGPRAAGGSRGLRQRRDDDPGQHDEFHDQRLDDEPGGGLDHHGHRQYHSQHRHYHSRNDEQHHEWHDHGRHHQWEHDLFDHRQHDVLKGVRTKDSPGMGDRPA